MKSISISTKVHIPLVASILIGFIIILISFFSSVSDIENKVYQLQSHKLKNYFEESLASKSTVGITNAINIANNFYVVESLKKNNRQLAIDGLTKLSKDYRNNTKFKNIKIHIHDANVHSFLRAWNPKKYGDDLSGFRHTINHVKQTKKPLVAIEIGVAGFVLRGLSPVILDGQYLGSVEFMQGLNSIVSDGKKHDIDVAIFMDNKYLNIAKELQNAPRFENYTLAVMKDFISTEFVSIYMV